MSPPILLTLKHHRPHRPPPRPRHNRQLPREMAQTQRHLGDPPLRPLPPEALLVVGVRDFAVDAQTRRGTGRRVPVYGDPG